ncbi:hypothetical protein FRC07_011400, partial [Ceratobasidium sp. 392]
DLEEDPELRATINLYRASEQKVDVEMGDAAKGKKGAKKSGGQYAMEGVETQPAEGEGEEDEADFPEVKLDELVEHFDEMGLEDENHVHE